MITRALLTLLLLFGVTAEQALAQGAGTLPPPPVRRTIDENGVDVLRGTFNVEQTDISIGGQGRRGLAFARSAVNGNWSDSSVATLDQVGNTVTVTIDDESDSFTDSAGTYIPTEGNGSSLSYSAPYYTYTSRSGVVARFTIAQGTVYRFYRASLGYLRDVTYPDGTRIDYLYQDEDYCPAGYENGQCLGQVTTAVRLLTIDHSDGYSLRFSYGYNGAVLTSANYREWSAIIAVKAVNRAVTSCAPTTVCGPAGAWPSATYTLAYAADSTATRTANDAQGRVTRTINAGNNGEMRIKRPGATTDNVVVTFNGTVSSVARDGVTHNYSYADNGTTRTTTVTAPDGGARVYTGDTLSFLLASFKDELNQVTSYTYDANGRVTRVTLPEGNAQGGYTQYSYDARGNITEVRRVAKQGSGLADIVTSATYPAFCSNPKTCNQPETTTDARGAVTNHAYSAATGQPTSITRPAPTTGATRPQTRFAYSSLQSNPKNSSGVNTPSGVPTSLPLSISTCATQANCTGTADEIKTAITYYSNTLLPHTVTSGNGSGTLTSVTGFGYDTVGNRDYVDGPLAGSGDLTRTLFNAVREPFGIIGPDPDGAGGRKHMAMRMTRNADAQITLAELGTTNGQTDADWAAFVSLEQTNTAYDANARKQLEWRNVSGGIVSARVQYNYDALGRPLCTAVRMNPATYGALPADACALATSGSHGPDRITRSTYDAASQPSAVQTALGTPDQANEARYHWTQNGKLRFLADGEEDWTTYEYDGHDRLTKTRYPSPTVRGTSSTTDYEQPSYDANGNVTALRLRDGQSIGFTYDALDRPTLKDLPGGEGDVTYAYDLLGRMTIANKATAGQSVFGWDALGRMTGEAQAFGSTAYQYDIAGRRTRLTWQDGLFVTYEHDVTGNMTAVRDEGGALIASFGYDDLARRTTLTRGNGTVTSYGYDAISRLSSLDHALAGTAHDALTTFVYNPASQISTRTLTNDAYALGALSNQNTPETPNGLNQLSQRGGTTLTYDARGNLTSDGATTYAYTSENHLKSASNGVSLYYDALGRLVEYDTSISLRHVYDGNVITADIDNPSGVVTRRYVHGPGVDEVLALYEGPYSNDKRWFHNDERGSIGAISGPGGTAFAINRYDEYGNPNPQTGRYGYTGQVWLGGLDMWYYKARIYNAKLGRFMQTDPSGYGAGVNLYTYVGGDPVNLVDPMGLLPYDLPVDPVEPEIIVFGRPDYSICHACNNPTSPNSVPSGFLVDRLPGSVSESSAGQQGQTSPTPTRKRSKKKERDKADRCTGVSDTMGGVGVSEACEAHDQCYRNGPSQQSCDVKFLRDLLDICGRSAGGWECRTAAIGYYLGVRVFGLVAFPYEQSLKVNRP